VTPERWQQIKTAFFGAIEHEDAHERATYLERACGDDVDLRQRVQSLLDQPPDEFDSLARDVRLNGTDPNTGRRIGAYELVREIGRGGMGAVWLARRADQQFEKVVAIKLLKRGTDTDEVLRRFQIERQILARLENPNIARLLDGGITNEDLPYFVMEFVEGRPITNFCEEKALNLGQRLRLFLKVCGAVQFAHQNLVVHRDLKPGNILVTADGEPKLLDFGIAKLLSPDEATPAVTMAEHQRLTPAYASPEQVRGEPITTLSDVYSLGALLYEIVTGKGAHRFSGPHPPPTELLRVVAQEEPIRPSAATTDSSAARHLRGDVDNIILKALRKEPGRRYPGVGSLAADLQRHLANEPVSARKDTLAYRASRFILRNKIGAAAAAIVLLTLIGAVIGISYQAQRAKRRFNEVRSLAHSILFEYHDSIANLPGSTAVREKLVRDSLNYLGRLEKEAGSDRALQREIAAAYRKVADVQGQPNSPNLGQTSEAMESYQKALGLWQRLVAAEPNDIAATSELAIVHSRIGELLRAKGDLKTGAEHNRKAVALMEGVTARGHNTPETRETLALCYTALADITGNPVLANLGDVAGAMELYNRALEVREALMAEDPTNPERQQLVSVAHQRVGMMLQARNDVPGAIQHFNRCLEIDEPLLKQDPTNNLKQRTLALDYQYSSLAAWDARQDAQARDYQLKNIQLAEQMVKIDPNDATRKNTLASGYVRMLYLLGRGGDMAGATEYENKMRALVDPLIANDPANSNYLATLRGADERMADVYLRAKDGASALRYALEELELNNKMLDLQPSNTNVRRSLAATHAQLGRAYKLIASHSPDASAATLEDWRKARDEFQQSLAIYTELKSKGALVGSEPARMEQVSGEIANCEAALKTQTPGQTR
jgi:serine/threonine protein kinase